MRIKKMLFRSALITFALLLLFPWLALAQTWSFSFPIEVLDTSGTARVYPPVLTGVTGQSLIDAGYINATGTDTNMEISGTSVPYMMSTTQIATVAPNLGAGSEVTFDLRTGYAPVQTEFPIIVGHNGYVTTSDAAALEPVNSFEIEQKGWLDTAYVANKNLFIKQGAFRTYVSAATDVTASIGGDGQPMVGGQGADTLNPAAIEYNCLMGGGVWNAAENQVYQCIPTGGTINGLHIRLSAAPGAGDSYTFTLMVNGAPTALAVTISGAADTTGNDWNAIAVVAGDTVSLRSSFAGAPGAPTAAWTTLWNPTIEGESICLVSMQSNLGAVRFSEIQGRGSVGGETRIQAPVPTAGTFKKLYVQLDVDPGNAPDAYSFTLRDALADTALTCTITADDTTGNDAVNTVAVAAGALVDIEVTPLNAPAAQPECAIGMVFDSATDGESLIMGGNTDPTAANSTEYLELCTANTAIWGAEASAYSLIQSCVLSKLYVSLEAAPGGAQTYTVSIREAGGDTGLTVTIAGAATTGNDVVNTYTSLNGDVADTRYVSSVGVVITRIHWGVVASNPVAEVTVAGVASGVREVVLADDGVNLTLSVYDDIGVHQGNSPQSIAFAGSVPDNDSDWVWNENDTMPYMEYIKVTTAVGGVSEKLWYQPIAMITATTIPDRDGADENGTITWGANTNMTITFGGIESYAATSAAVAETEIGYSVPAATMPTGWFGETALSPTLPFYDNFSDISTDTGIPIRTLYVIPIFAVAMALGFGVFMVFKPMLIAFGVTGVIIFAGCNMNVIPWWVLFTYGVVGIALIYGRRQL